MKSILKHELYFLPECADASQYHTTITRTTKMNVLVVKHQGNAQKCVISRSWPSELVFITRIQVWKHFGSTNALKKKYHTIYKTKSIDKFSTYLKVPRTAIPHRDWNWNTYKSVEYGNYPCEVHLIWSLNWIYIIYNF